MSILSLLKLVLSFADTLASLLREHQLEEAGKAIQNSANLKAALDANDKADAIVRDVDAGVLHDPFNPKRP